VRQAALGAFAHQDYPFARLAEDIGGEGGERDASRPAIFQTLFVLYRERGEGERGLAGLALGAAGERCSLGGLALRPLELARRSAQLDLSLLMADLGGGLAGALQFSTDLFDAATIERLAGHLGALLAAVAETASGSDGAARRLADLPLLSAAERHQLREWNAGAGDGAPADLAAVECVHELIAAQARRTPGAVAVEAPAADGEGWVSLTYQELDARAAALAARLRRLGVGPEKVVAICAERSLALVVGLLAILKAGGAYLPLDRASGGAPARHDADTRARLAVAQADSARRGRGPARGAGGGDRLVGDGAGGGAGWWPETAPRRRRRRRGTGADGMAAAGGDDARGPSSRGGQRRSGRRRRRATADERRRHGDRGRRHASDAGAGDGQPGLRDLHVGFDRAAQGDDEQPPRHRQPAAVDAAAVRLGADDRVLQKTPAASTCRCGSCSGR
jgi:hypothetical protein